MKIPIQNLYYLLCFAWNRVPQELAFDVSTIPASADVLDLCAHLLTTGTDLLLRRGLDRGYILHEEQTARVRGRIVMSEMAKLRANRSPQVVCQFDELSVNVLHNQILRATVGSLLSATRVASGLEAELRVTHRSLAGIDDIEVTPALFGRVQLHRNNGYYAFLLLVCRLVNALKLPDHGTGVGKFRDLISDEKIMEKVFEEFLRNFYRIKQREFLAVGSSQLRWDATADDLRQLELLPVMKTDITMRSADRIIIMDAKYYRSALQEHHDTAKVHSSNLYQLTAYLRSESSQQQWIKPEGILIYPVGENMVDAAFTIDGFQVRLFTLNLNQDWRRIEYDLLNLISTRPARAVAS